MGLSNKHRCSGAVTIPHRVCSAVLDCSSRRRLGDKARSLESMIDCAVLRSRVNNRSQVLLIRALQSLPIVEPHSAALFSLPSSIRRRPLRDAHRHLARSAASSRWSPRSSPRVPSSGAPQQQRSKAGADAACRRERGSKEGAAATVGAAATGCGGNGGRRWPFVGYPTREPQAGPSRGQQRTAGRQRCDGGRNSGHSGAAVPATPRPALMNPLVRPLRGKTGNAR